MEGTVLCSCHVTQLFTSVEQIKRPPEFKLTLMPLNSMGGSLRERLQVEILTNKKTICMIISRCLFDSTQDTQQITRTIPPHLQLTDQQRLSDDSIKQLLKEVNQLAKERTGEV